MQTTRITTNAYQFTNPFHNQSTRRLDVDNILKRFKRKHPGIPPGGLALRKKRLRKKRHKALDIEAGQYVETMIREHRKASKAVREKLDQDVINAWNTPAGRTGGTIDD